MKIEYHMSEEDLEKILEASKPVPMIALQCGMPRSPQQKANDAWAALGKRMGFDSMTVEPLPSKGDRYFMAEPIDPEEVPAIEKEPEAEKPAQGFIDIVFDGPPAHESGRFIEVEDENGCGTNVGEWVERPDGFWALRIPRGTI